jgi:oligo-1,6-glucosidase
MTMRGTPFYYNGDELGMTNAGFTSIDDFRDVATRNEYQHRRDLGDDMGKFLAEIQFSSRDNGRTPFQWDNSSNAGFTTGTPWIKVNPNYTAINEAQQDKDPRSVLNYFRKIVQLRKNYKTLVYGKYTLLDKDNPDVYAYSREGEGKKLLVLLNFSAGNATARPGLNMARARPLLSDYNDQPAAPAAGQTAILLRPYEAVVYELP